jgi:hypothetical protein
VVVGIRCGFGDTALGTFLFFLKNLKTQRAQRQAAEDAEKSLLTAKATKEFVMSDVLRVTFRESSIYLSSMTFRG